MLLRCCIRPEGVKPMPWASVNDHVWHVQFGIVFRPRNDVRSLYLVDGVKKRETLDLPMDVLRNDECDEELAVKVVANIFVPSVIGNEFGWSRQSVDFTDAADIALCQLLPKIVLWSSNAFH